MMTLQSTMVLGTLESVGLTVGLTPDFGLMVSPARLLTNELRDIIRAHKPALVDLLKREADADQAKAEFEAIEEGIAIMQHDGGLARDLAAVMAKRHFDFLVHHWKCTACIAAGLGRGQRCPTGSDLWTRYQDAEAAADAAKPKAEGNSK